MTIIKGLWFSCFSIIKSRRAGVTWVGGIEEKNDA